MHLIEQDRFRRNHLPKIQREAEAWILLYLLSLERDSRSRWKPQCFHRERSRSGADASTGETVSWVLIAILGYVLVQFAIGTWVSRRMASEADYILAGRRLGVGLITFSVFA